MKYLRKLRVSLISKKIIFSLGVGLALIVLLQATVLQLPYFKALAQCVDPENPRADFLITSQSQGSTNKFTSRIGTCIFDPKAVIGDFRQTTYDELYDTYFVKSKYANKTVLPSATGGDANNTHLNNQATDRVFLVKKSSPTSTDGNFTISGNPTPASPVRSFVVFVEGNLYVRSNYTFGDTTHGTVFMVKGNVFIDTAVTSIGGIIITQGNLCTAADFSTSTPTCPGTSVLTASPLVVDGTLVALDKTKPISFRRRLADNSVAAEQINQQTKYLVIMNQLLARTSSIVSEGTDYAICSAANGKPVGCACTTGSNCASGLCSQTGGTGPLVCQQASNYPVPTGGSPTPIATQTPLPAQPTFPPKLVAHWKLDETSGQVATDSAGSNNGAVSATSIKAGRFGYARRFHDGAYISVNNSPAFGAQKITVSMWIKPINLTTNPTAGLFNYRNSLNQLGINIQLTATRKVACSLTVNNSGTLTSQTVTSTTSVVAFDWNLVVCTFDGSLNNNQAKIYALPPGSTVTAVSASLAGPLNVPTNGLVTIGKESVTNKSFLGYLDDIRVYSYALSATEITDLFNTPPSPGAAFTTNPWKIFGLEELLEAVNI